MQDQDKPGAVRFYDGDISTVTKLLLYAGTAKTANSGLPTQRYWEDLYACAKRLAEKIELFAKLPTVGRYDIDGGPAQDIHTAKQLSEGRMLDILGKMEKVFDKKQKNGQENI